MSHGSAAYKTAIGSCGGVVEKCRLCEISVEISPDGILDLARGRQNSSGCRGPFPGFPGLLVTWRHMS